MTEVKPDKKLVFPNKNTVVGFSKRFGLILTIAIITVLVLASGMFLSLFLALKEV